MDMKYKIGQKVKITGNESGHGFKIGEIVLIEKEYTKREPFYYYCSSLGESYTIYEIDIEEIQEENLKINDSDIATVEALHDLLLDAHGYSLEHRTLKNARELTKKLYKMIGLECN